MFKNKNNQKAFTLVETLIGLAIIVIIAAGVFGIYKAVMRSAGIYETRTIATNLATEQMEMIRNMPYLEIGTTEGWPAGDIPSVSSPKNINNINYTIHTDIQYIDDPFDELAPDDPYNADYKKTRVWVSWDKIPCASPVILVTTIVPKGQESIEGGGTLSIKVFNNAPTVVPQVSVHIENNDLDPAINITTQTNDQGELIVPALPIDTGNNYAITVSKDGYTSDYTVEATLANPNPVLSHQSIQEGIITSISFTIDLVSNLTINTTGSVGGEAWWDVAYQYRKQLTLQNNSADPLPANSSIKFDLDHYILAQEGKALVNGDDIRIVYFDGANWHELNRINKTDWNASGSPTKIWFQNQSEIIGSGSDNNYYIYYNNNVASSPPTDLTQIFTPGNDANTSAVYYYENGTGNTINDSSGYNNDGIITNIDWTSGKSGQAILYNVSGDWAYATISAPDSSSLDIEGPITLESWIYPQDNTTGNKSIIDRLNNYALWLNNGHPSFGVYDQIAGLKSIQAIDTVPIDTWTHIAGTYASGEMKIYINSHEKASKNETVTYITINSSDMLLGNGHNFGAHASQFIGKIDESRISTIVHSSFPYSAIANITVSQGDEETVVGVDPITSVLLDIIGERPIGYDGLGDPIFRNQFLDQTTNDSGQLILSDIEWDRYTITEKDPNYDLAEISPPSPVNVIPGENQIVTMVLVPHADNTLRITVINSAEQPIESAQVRVYNTDLGFDETKITSSAGQVFFTPLSIVAYNIEIIKAGFENFSGSEDVSGQTEREVVLAPQT